MIDFGRYGRFLCAIGVGLFGVALAAGVTQSLRISGRPPAIDLLRTGRGDYIKYLLSQKDYDAVIHELEIQTRIPPVDPDALKRLGQLLDSQGRPEEARARFQEYVRLRPHDAEGHRLLGFTCIETNQPDVARRCFQEALDIDPRDAPAYYGLGMAWAHLGDVAQAEKCFAKSVELAPNDVKSQINLERARKELRASQEKAPKS